MSADSLSALQQRLREFASVRDWDEFHDPKNLAMALAVEVGELMEPFQWLNTHEARDLARDPESDSAVRDELADVAIYLLRLADVLGVDLGQAIVDKIATNEQRYPAERVRGRADVGPLDPP